MREKIGAILATATVLSGCSFSSYGEETPEWRPEQIQVEDFPHSLPQAVSDQIPNVVSITNEVVGYDILLNDYRLIDICSGVRIDKSDYLSAGHCVDPRDIPKDISPICHELRVDEDRPIEEGGGVTLNAEWGSGHAPNTSNPHFLDLKDILLVHTNSDTLPDYSDRHNPPEFYDHSHPIESGTQLFFVNYQPAADAKYRNPNENAEVIPEFSRGPNTPAILGGIAIRYVNSDTVEVIPAGISYDETGETEARQGGSGGPVYDANGRLVALLTAMTNDPISIRQFETERGIDIIGLPDDMRVRPLYIKTVSQDEIDALKDDIFEFSSCDKY